MIEFLIGLFETIDMVSIVTVLILVWLWGELGATGKVQLISSFATGVVVGIIQRYSTGDVAGMASWFQTIAYGIILGGMASGAYETIKSALSKGMIETLEAEEIDIVKPEG